MLAAVGDGVAALGGAAVARAVLLLRSPRDGNVAARLYVVNEASDGHEADARRRER